MKGDFLCVVLLLCENSPRIRKMCDLLDSKGDILKVNTGFIAKVNATQRP